MLPNKYVRVDRIIFTFLANWSSVTRNVTVWSQNTVHLLLMFITNKETHTSKTVPCRSLVAVSTRRRKLTMSVGSSDQRPGSVLYAATTLATTSAVGGVYWSTSASVKQLHHKLSGWDVRFRLSNWQPMSPPLRNTRRPGSSTNQTGKIRKKKFLCVWSAAVELTTTDRPWCIIDTDSVLRWHDWRLFCFPESTRRHHHSASVTVSAVKFVCANTNLLTYLVTY